MYSFRLDRAADASRGCLLRQTVRMERSSGGQPSPKCLQLLQYQPVDLLQSTGLRLFNWSVSSRLDIGLTRAPPDPCAGHSSVVSLPGTAQSTAAHRDGPSDTDTGFAQHDAVACGPGEHFYGNSVPSRLRHSASGQHGGSGSSSSTLSQGLSRANILK